MTKGRVGIEGKRQCVAGEEGEEEAGRGVQGNTKMAEEDKGRKD